MVKKVLWSLTGKESTIDDTQKHQMMETLVWESTVFPEVCGIQVEGWHKKSHMERPEWGWGTEQN